MWGMARDLKSMPVKYSSQTVRGLNDESSLYRRAAQQVKFFVERYNAFVKAENVSQNKAEELILDAFMPLVEINGYRPPKKKNSDEPGEAYKPPEIRINTELKQTTQPDFRARTDTVDDMSTHIKEWSEFSEFVRAENLALHPNPKKPVSPFWSKDSDLTHEIDVSNRKKKKGRQPIENEGLQIEWIQRYSSYESFNIVVLGKTDHAHGLILPAYSFTFHTSVQMTDKSPQSAEKGFRFFNAVEITSVMNDLYRNDFPEHWETDRLV